MGRSLVRRNRWVLPALCLLLVLPAVGCRDSGIAGLEDIALSSHDVPADWVAADFDEAEGRALWEVLPELLTVNTEARLYLRAFQAEGGRHGIATILIQTEQSTALPRAMEGQRVLGPLARLLVEEDALLAPSVRGGDPGTYFATSDVPLPGSLRSRLVRLLDEGYLYSDSVIFSAGPVLAVVTVWYPEEDGPFREVGELADEVERRLRIYLDSS